MGRLLIDKTFIRELKLSPTTFIFKYFEFDDIVPENLTHNFLLKEFSIDKSIFNYYCDKLEFLNKVEKDFVKTKLHIDRNPLNFKPYVAKIGNAYYRRHDLVLKLESLFFNSANKKFCDGNEIIYFTDLIPYFKDYSKGFKKGYNEFEKQIIEPYLTPISDKQDWVFKVFDYLTRKKSFSRPSWKKYKMGFSLIPNNNHYNICHGFKDGLTQGYFYKAWTIILSNNNLFTELFNGIEQNNQVVNTTNKLKKASDVRTKQSGNEIFKFENNFDNVDEGEVYNFFFENLVEKKWLNKNEFEKYLKSAFQNNTPTANIFKLKNIRTKQKVYRVFYKYYKEVAQKPHGKSTEYAELLGSYFQGYKTSIIKTNWSK